MSVQFEKRILRQERIHIQEILSSPSPNAVLSYFVEQLAMRPEIKKIFIDIVQQNKEFPQLELVLPEYAEAPKSTATVPVSEGRRIVSTERVNGTILRLEYVPCGSSRCRKRPDEHGPYWYSYRLVDGKWTIRYYGTTKPASPPMISFKEAKDIIGRISKLNIIEEEDIHALYRILAAFASDDNKITIALKDSTISLIEREHMRREYLVRDRHRRLLSKAESGRHLNKKEQKDLENAAALLADDH
jgi:hypothetical protein